ncbi:toxin VasX [Photobacterium damselae]|uniref:toxin VasX n=1 Tax=Photobacterium damselae TaxID=38293 RepID=UPI00165E0B75|nr:toxin VasX [Photobacterium damselae]
MPSDAYNSAEIAGTKSPSSPAGTCPLQTKEVGIIPVRYAIDATMGTKALFPLPEGDDWQPTFNINLPYTLRQLRDGWLYVYSKKQKVLHTYQIENAVFTAQHEGGTCAACLTYDSDDTLWLSYSHQRWTSRLIELFSTEKKYREQWMRQLNIQAFRLRMKGPHAGMAKKLESSVADIGSVTQDIINGFAITSTPLNADDTESNSGFEFNKAKPANPASTYQVTLPESNVGNGLFIALEDPLADITDIALKLGSLHAQKEMVFGSDEDKHKQLISEFVRSIARVSYDPKTAPEALKTKLKDNPQEVLKFESVLNQYLRYQSPLNQAQYGSEAYAANALPYDQPRQEAQSILNNTYHYTPTDKDFEHFESRKKNIDLVDWDKMSIFLDKKYAKLKAIEGDAATMLAELNRAFKDLGVYAARVGVDIEETQGQLYLNTFFGHLFPLMAAVSQKWDAAEEETLLALAPFYYSPEFSKAINKAIPNDALSVTNASDMTNMVSRLGETIGFIYDGRIPESDEATKALITRVIQAAKNAITTAGDHVWDGLMDGLFPHQVSGESGLDSGLRLMVARSLVSKEGKLLISSDYVSKFDSFSDKLNPLLQKAEQLSGRLHANSTTAMRNNLNEIKEKIAKLIADEMPLLIKFEQEAMNDAVRRKLAASIRGLRSRFTSTVGQAIDNVNGVGTVVGGFAAICNLWNLWAVSQQVTSKLNNANSTQDQADVYVELASALSWTLSAFAGVGRDSQVIASKFVEMTVKDAITKTGSNLNQQVVIKRFAAAAKATAIFGLFAASTETYLTVRQMFKSDSFFEQMLLVGKAGALVVQGGVSFAQFAYITTDVAIGGIVAAWMVSTLFYAGIAYLLFSALYNYYHRDEIQNWLLHCAWGKSPKPQTLEQELTALENIIWKPNIELTKNSVDIYLPSYLLDDDKKHFDVQIVTKNKYENTNLSYASPEVTNRYSEQFKPKQIDVSKARRKNTANGVGYISIPVPHNEGDEVIIAINYDRAWTEECQSYVGTRSSTGTFDLERTKDVVSKRHGVAGLTLPVAG